MARAAAATAAAALQPRRLSVPAVRVAPLRRPLLLSHQSLWTTRVRQPHHPAASPRSKTLADIPLHKKGKARHGCLPPITPLAQLLCLVLCYLYIFVLFFSLIFLKFPPLKENVNTEASKDQCFVYNSELSSYVARCLWDGDCEQKGVALANHQR